MAVDDKWGRWEHYQKTGKFPMTTRQERNAIRKNKRAREFRESTGGAAEVVGRINQRLKEQADREAQNRLF